MYNVLDNLLDIIFIHPPASHHFMCPCLTESNTNQSCYPFLHLNVNMNVIKLV